MTATDRIRSVVPPYLLRAVADADAFPRAADHRRARHHDAARHRRPARGRRRLR
ncbi:hypothetical protein NYS50_05800 [Curtobacterium flaccumfaciens pv. flaccumfaciens]|uniref:hypothetical protein n=1 Tax=Curtobacterium flaccumfaciens TaxID=2035 RepID=UPI00217EA5F4|nr:hypothetical protein [Curtobacterium flaccumfaciens]MCS6547386.1 hypothetical protein [Curtobacterium flaccumfaciens pv. flaccumfaciens]